MNFPALLLQLGWSGFASSFNSDTLNSTYWSCWFALWSEPLSWAISCSTEYISGSTVSTFGCVSKLDFCATFLGYIFVGVDIKVDLLWTLTHAYCLILYLNLSFLLDPLLLFYVNFMFLDINLLRWEVWFYWVWSRFNFISYISFILWRNFFYFWFPIWYKLSEATSWCFLLILCPLVLIYQDIVLLEISFLYDVPSCILNF